MKKFLLVLCIGFFTIQNVSAQKALKVWVVRHAEKITSNPKDKDPELSSEGSVRAEALLKLLKGEKIDSIFTTNFKRTKLTAFPLADKIGLALKMYNSADQKTFAKQLMANAKGKNILIVGHSNTVLEAIEAFGGVKPMAELKDEDYDYIFLLTIKNGKTEVKVERYGAKRAQ
jgi:broad specificity phosphatase PhoE